VLTGDGVHLNADGNRFVADRMLEGLGVAVEASAAK
jgi:lysophospholipase L1-like esterase